jgi:glycosyltransferase involved in cell wall biosynthesis
MRILHVSTSDRGGGAEKLALELSTMARDDQHEAVLAVGHLQKKQDGVVCFNNDQYRRLWPGFWRARQNRYYSIGSPVGARLSGWLANLGEPWRWLQWHLGYEDFHYPGVESLIDRLPFSPDIIHLHNLHGNYFDLRALKWLTGEYPVLLTLHDEWALTGHCAYTFDCQRWQTGCGLCPNLATYPALKRDGTRFNLDRKRDIYSQSRLYVSAASQWLIDRARRSVLSEAMIESRVIPYGIDLETFRPIEKKSVRARLNIPDEALVVVFVANRAVTNEYKDYSTLESSIRMVAADLLRWPVYFIAIGEEAPEVKMGSIVLKRYGYQTSPRDIAIFYQAADIYIHAARAEAFGLVIAEAMACQLPVIATDVGGISEVVDDQVNGYLVPKGDCRLMADRIVTLLKDRSLRHRMGEKAREKALQKYDRWRHYKDYLGWYRQIIERRK